MKLDTTYYPRLLWRLRAAMIDAVVVPVAMIGCLLTGVALGVTDPIIKVALLIVPLFLLEPLLVAYSGGTVGHHLIRLRVQRQGSDANISVVAATLRFVIKALTGWFSFLFVLTSRRHQALHDIFARSVVVHRDASKVPAHEALIERKAEEEAFIYPPIWRRVLVIFGYVLLILVIANIAVALSVSYACINQEICREGDRTVLLILEVSWLAATSVSVVLGWKGKLPGARRRIKR